MAFTWGFIVIFFFITFPGLIIRRLYFYGEFSKQYSAGQPLVKIGFYAILPGLINCLAAFLSYEYFLESIDLGGVIDIYKVLASDTEKFSELSGTPIKESFKDKVLPFIGLIYFYAILFGSIAGRMVSKLGLDGFFKVLRFKNQWFYLLNGHHGKLKKFKKLKSKNKFLFAKADVLVDTSEGTKLYSGNLVDYELDEQNPSNLNKVYLQEAKRYGKDESNKMCPKDIPGHLLIVDCKNLINLNLTFVYEQYQSGKNPPLKQFLYYLPIFLNLILTPFYFYQFKFIDFEYYHYYFDMSVIGKIFAYFFMSQLISVLQLFKEQESKFHLLSWREHVAKLGAIVLTFILMILAEWVSQLVLALF